MASGRRHWTLRLRRLLANQRWLSRADRRQLRKLLGRECGVEWRSFGNQRRGLPRDGLTRAILDRARAVGHLSQRLGGPA